MQSKTRGVRHLLVSTGMIGLVLSVAAPAALADAAESKRGKGGAKDRDAEVEGTEEPAVDRKVWVCHLTSSDDNRWELNHVSVASEGPAGDELQFPDQDALAGFTNKNDLLAALEAEAEVGGETLDELVQDGCDAVNNLGGSNAGGNGDSAKGGSDDNGVGEGTGGGKTGNNGVGQGGGGGVIVDTPIETVVPGTGKPVVVVAPEVVEVPVKNAPIAPATPVQPIPAPQPRSVVNISADTVTKPVVPAQPTSPAPAPQVQQNEVLGAVTTRTPTPGVGALDPGTHTAASITALAATGADGTKVLAVAGTSLLLSGLGLQVSGRLRMRSAVVGA